MVRAFQLPRHPGPKCHECPLYTSGLGYVTPSGNPNAPIVVVGEAPGREETIRGENFVGGSGKLLRVLLRKSGYNPDSGVYYLNTVRCRPPLKAGKDQPPPPEAVEACSPLLEAALAGSAAKVVLAAGRTALERFLGAQHPIFDKRRSRSSWDCYLYRPGREIPDLAVVGKKRGRFGEPLKSGKFKGQPKMATVPIALPTTLPPNAVGVVGALHPAAVIYMGFTPLVQLARAIYHARCAAAGKVPLDNPGHLITTIEGAWEWLGHKQIDPDVVAFDIETTRATEQIERIGFAFGDTTITVPWDDGAKELTQHIFDTAQELIAHNAPFDVGRLEAVGIQIDATKIRDTMMAAYMDEPDLPKGLGHVIPRYLLAVPHKHEAEDRPEFYNGMDAHTERVLWVDVLRPRLEQKRMLDRFLNVRMPGIHVLRKMTERGIRVSPASLEKWHNGLEAKVVDGIAKWNKETGGVNHASTKELRELFFEKLGLKAPRLTAKGYLSVDEDSLLRLKPQSRAAAELIDILLEIRGTEKMLSTYARDLSIGDDGCVHPEYIPRLKDAGDPEIDKSKFGTGSHRLSASNPNIQNQPVEARHIYVPHKPGWVIWECDYSQIELRIVAHRAKEKWLIEALSDPTRDVHQETADFLTKHAGVKVVRDTGTEFPSAKTIRYAIYYGVGRNHLAEQLHVTQTTSGRIIDAWRVLEPNVFRQWDTDIANAAKQGWLANPFGTRRNFPGFANIAAKQKHVRNMAINYVPQSSVAEMMWELLPTMERDTILLTQIHDAFVGECPAEDVTAVQRTVQRRMERTWDQIAPGWVCPTDFAVGESWGRTKFWAKEAKKLSKSTGKHVSPVEAWIAGGQPSYQGD